MMIHENNDNLQAAFDYGRGPKPLKRSGVNWYVWLRSFNMSPKGLSPIIHTDAKSFQLPSE